jgi:hypothetical protein
MAIYRSRSIRPGWQADLMGENGVDLSVGVRRLALPPHVIGVDS